MLAAFSLSAQAVHTDFSLPGIVTSSFPNFSNDMKVTYRSGKRGATLTASKIGGSDMYLNFSETDNYLISHGSFRLKADFDPYGNFLGGTVKIRGGIDTDFASGNGVLMTAILKPNEFAFDDDLIGFNTTDIICPLFDFCTHAESVFLSLDAGGFSTELKRYTSTGLAVTSVPVPAAAWLFGSGLIGLVGMARKKAM